MPWHCDACRQLRHKQRKEKAATETSAASPAAIVVSQAPQVAVVSPAPAVSSIGVPLTRPAQISNASEKSWNEIVELGNSEEFLFYDF